MKHTRATEALRNCERELRSLLAECASSGDYEGVLELTALAQAVAELSARGAKSPYSEMDGSARNEPSPSEKKQKPGDTYPKFFKTGDDLVKVGWSKRERREYHHRAPSAAISAMGGALRKVGGKGRLFNGGDLLPLKNNDGARAIPDYQAYVALAWLKELGLVKQRGRRGGYRLNGNGPTEEIVSAAWSKLPEWNG